MSSKAFFEPSRDSWPPRKRSRGISDALRALQPGESVLLPTSYSSAGNLLGALYRRGTLTRGEYTVRSTGDGECRVWRLEPNK